MRRSRFNKSLTLVLNELWVTARTGCWPPACRECTAVWCWDISCWGFTRAKASLISLSLSPFFNKNFLFMSSVLARTLSFSRNRTAVATWLSFQFQLFSFLYCSHHILPDSVLHCCCPTFQFLIFFGDFGLGNLLYKIASTWLLHSIITAFLCPLSSWAFILGATGLSLVCLSPGYLGIKEYFWDIFGQ